MAVDSKLLLVFLFILNACGSGTAYRRFQNLVPNGDNVPHSCRENFFWHGVGHNDFFGGGALNRFGRDFQKTNHVWKDVCQLDSDGDGMTNGYELGDPNCIWKIGEMPERIVNISNPGVCDPFKSKFCTGVNYFLKCEPYKHTDCPEIHEEGIKNITIMFPETKIPVKRTTYYNMLFELPQDGDYHLIATKPVLVSKNLIHHMQLLGCNEYDDISSIPLNEPREYRTWPKCNVIIGGWGFGSYHSHECTKEEMAYRFGVKKGFKKALLQFHYNNPDGNPNYTDSSGVTLYYTSRLRKYDKGHTVTGSEDIYIPPGKDRVVVTGICSSRCTRKYMKGPVYIYSFKPHTHHLAKAVKSELYRNGTRIAVIGNEEHFQYDHKITKRLEEPIEVLPGDEIRTTCVYSSKYQRTPVRIGRGFNSETCLAYFEFYPIENGLPSRCESYKHRDYLTRFTVTHKS